MYIFCHFYHKSCFFFVTVLVTHSAVCLNHSVFTASCNDTTRIVIYSASYGVHDVISCSDSLIQCSLRNVIDILNRDCSGKISCEVEPELLANSSACDLHSSVYVQYECVPGKHVRRDVTYMYVISAIFLKTSE